MKVSFKSRKLNNSIKRVTDKAKNLDLSLDSLFVYGVTKEEGVIVTGKEIGKNLGEYYYFSGQKIAYNPYRANIGSIGITNPDFKGLMSPAYVIFEVDNSIYIEFLLLYLKSNIGQELIKWYGDRGGVRSSLRFSDLGRIDFPDISYEDQKNFLFNYSRRKLKIDELFKEMTHQEDLLAKFKKSAFQEAINGVLTESWRSNYFTNLVKEKLVNLKHYKHNKFDEKEKSSDIPEEWKLIRLGNLVKIQNGFAFKSSMYSNQGVKLLRNTNIYNGKIDWSEVVYYSSEDIKNLSKYNLEIDDIVISLDRPIISSGLKIAIIKKDDLPCMLLQRVGRISCSNTELNHLFLYYWFNSSYFISNLNIGEGLGVPHISSKEVENMKIAVPPIEEQVEIVRITNELMSFYEKMLLEITNRRTRLDKLLQLYISRFIGSENSIFITNETDNKKVLKIVRNVKYDSKTKYMELVDLLKKHGKLHAEDLWKMSKHYDGKNIGDSIDKFYGDLKEKIEVDKTIKELKDEKGYLDIS